MKTPCPSLCPTYGAWSGASQLFLPGSPVQTSAATATVTPLLQGLFLEVRYTWSYQKEPQEGLLLVGKSQLIFADSWHMGESVLLCQGSERPEGGLSAFGTYPVEGDPDWGWRTVLEGEADRFRITMYNVPPTGQGAEELGFTCVFTRA